jgi:hypothetical protein
LINILIKILERTIKYSVIDGLSLDDLEHFVLSHLEVTSVGRPAEGSVTLLTLNVSAVTVVSKRKVCKTVPLLVTTVHDTNVVPSPEYWTII